MHHLPVLLTEVSAKICLKQQKWGMKLSIRCMKFRPAYASGIFRLKFPMELFARLAKNSFRPDSDVISPQIAFYLEALCKSTVVKNGQTQSNLWDGLFAETGIKSHY